MQCLCSVFFSIIVTTVPHYILFSVSCIRVKVVLCTVVAQAVVHDAVDFHTVALLVESNVVEEGKGW